MINLIFLQSQENSNVNPLKISPIGSSAGFLKRVEENCSVQIGSPFPL